MLKRKVSSTFKRENTLEIQERILLPVEPPAKGRITHGRGLAGPEGLKRQPDGVAAKIPTSSR